MNVEVKLMLDFEQRGALQEVSPPKSQFLLLNIAPYSGCHFRCRFSSTDHKNLIKKSDYHRSAVGFGVFEKLIDNLSDFPQLVKVMQMNKINIRGAG